MSAITYAQVQELVTQLPEAKLATAYDLLLRLTRQAETASINPTDFMRLPLRERRRLMEKQAAYMMEYYEQTATERDEWQAGEFAEYQAG